MTSRGDMRRILNASKAVLGRLTATALILVVLAHGIVQFAYESRIAIAAELRQFGKRCFRSGA